jgi:demethylmenaquinone methyltransferase/2-methoxy-6-polyprenyl-1,4-benzoquinol methylase
MNIQPEISRVLRSKQQAITAYNRFSRWYDRLSVSSEWPMTVFGLHKLDVSTGETVLEIGFGTGNALLVLAKAVSPTGKVAGIDISPGMFDVARQKLSHAGFSGQVTLQQGDAAALPYQAGSFNAVFISFTLELFDSPEIPTVLAECRRILKPGGRMVVVALARDEHENIPLQIYEWFHQILPSYVDCRPIYLQSALSLAGFLIQDVTRKWMWGLPVEICLAKNPAAAQV